MRADMKEVLAAIGDKARERVEDAKEHVGDSAAESFARRTSQPA